MATHIAHEYGSTGYKVANPARGQLNRENEFSLPVFAPENLVSRDGLGSPVSRHPAHLHTQADLVVTECKERTIHTQTQIVASRKPKEIKRTHEGEANFTT